MSDSANSKVGYQPRADLPELSPGDAVKVTTRIKEGDKERSQTMEGVVIGLRGGGVAANFTVRRVTYGVGVERTFPIHSPLLEKVEVLRHGKVRRARLYYLRALGGKAARLKEKRALRGVEAKDLGVTEAVEPAEVALVENPENQP
ncbi:MAG: ribosomal protein [Dehalococcoidia bacterium]|nr:ribosomal protein [Dehalococcoidia bacterium]